MENKKTIVALSDDALDAVSGGLVINSDHVIDQRTGITYPIIGDRQEIRTVVLGLGGYATDPERIAALLAAGLIAPV